MIGYATKVKADIVRWRSAGLIDAETAAALSRDIETKHKGISFGAVLSLMAAALLSAAILLLVAANWEAIPRIARVALLLGLILVGYVGGALLKLKGRDNAAEVAWITAAATFGAAIALIAQMYHLSGDEKQAILVWCLGTALAAGMLRSAPLTVGAVLLSAIWMVMQGLDDWWAMPSLPLAFPALAVSLFLLARWTYSVVGRHLVLLSLILFGFVHFAQHESLGAPLLLIVAGLALFALGYLQPIEAQRILQLGSGLPALGLLSVLVGIGILQLDVVDEPPFLFVSVLAFIAVVGALVLSGRENTALRWLAYAAFIFQLCFIYVVTVGSMLGTAGFFLVGAVAFAGLAWLISQLERRFGEPQPRAMGEQP